MFWLGWLFGYISINTFKPFSAVLSRFGVAGVMIKHAKPPYILVALH
jgi:hypothetical protein